MNQNSNVRSISFADVWAFFTKMSNDPEFANRWQLGVEHPYENCPVRMLLDDYNRRVEFFWHGQGEEAGLTWEFELDEDTMVWVNLQDMATLCMRNHEQDIGFHLYGKHSWGEVMDVEAATAREHLNAHRLACWLSGLPNGLNEADGWRRTTEHPLPVDEFFLAIGPCAFIDLPVDICRWDGQALWNEDGTEMCDTPVRFWRSLPTDGWLDLERFPPLRNAKSILLKGKGISNHVSGPDMTVSVVSQEAIADFLMGNGWRGVLAHAEAWMPVPELPEEAK